MLGEFPLAVLLPALKVRFHGLDLLCSRQQAHERSWACMWCVLEWSLTVELPDCCAPVLVVVVEAAGTGEAVGAMPRWVSRMDC
jgi:hypothetical protein